jgi:hypothetical protein
MAEQYFTKFKTINYSNTQAIDITERIVVTQRSVFNPYDYYPQDITEGQRPDQVAFQAFNDPYSSWMLYLTNQIVDPYYEWYLTDTQFVEFIKQKYGTVESAQQKVKYYRTNWNTEDSISVAAYDALSGAEKQYWQPNYNNGTNIVNYVRNQQDLFSTTNVVLNLTITGSNQFINDEIVTIKYDPTNYPTSSGKAQVVTANSTNLVIQHIFNDAFPHDAITITSNSYVYGTESQSNCTVTACSFVSNNIPSDQFVYWSPVYYYDYEDERNAGNRAIRVLKSDFVVNFAQNVKQLLK